MIKNPPPELTEIPPGCVAVNQGRKTFVCDPAAALIPGDRVAISGNVELAGKTVPIQLVGLYHPGSPSSPGTVRLGVYRGPKTRWEHVEVDTPPWKAAKVIGVLTPPGKGRPKKGSRSRKRSAISEGL